MAGARHFSELVIWQLADALRSETVKLTNRRIYARNFRLREQTDDAADSICRNIAEGFAADTHGHFASYLRISRRSFNELKDAFISAEKKQRAN
jgi:four helix bundle protein